MAISENMTSDDGQRLQAFLRRKLNPALIVKLRQRPDECAEVYLGQECLGVVAKIVDEGEVSFSFELSVIEEDLEEE